MVASYYLSAFVLFVFLDVTVAQVIFPGECPKYPTQNSFNPAQFISAKVWYVIKRYPSAFEENSKCSWLEIIPSNVGKLTFSFNGVDLNDGSTKKAAGNGFFDYGELSKFLLDIPVSSWNTTSGIRWWVIGTDYKNFALAWSCDPICSGYHREQLWLLGRKPTLSPDIMEKVNSKYISAYFKTDYLIPVDQSNCPAVVVPKNVNSEDDLIIGTQF